MKRQAIDYEKIFTIHISHEGLVSRKYFKMHIIHQSDKNAIFFNGQNIWGKNTLQKINTQ